MVRLRIAAIGESTGAVNEARGRLFEDLVKRVMRQRGYDVRQFTRVNYAGMELDFEARALITDRPCMGEAKAHDRPIDAPAVQHFYAKFMARWRKARNLEGVIIALPALNPHARGFGDENIHGDHELVGCLIEEEDLLRHIWDASLAIRPESIAKSLSVGEGDLADAELVYTERGFFWLQRLLAPGSSVPTEARALRGDRVPITDQATLDFITSAHPEARDYRLKPADEARAAGQAGPRGLLVLGNSGLGKSSLVLKLVHMLGDEGHVAVALDCRAATNTDFAPAAVAYALRAAAQKVPELGDAGTRIGGPASCAPALNSASDALRPKGRALVILLDQFENLFALSSLLNVLRTLLATVSDAQMSVVIGFCWKSDLLGLHEDFPYRLREELRARCLEVRLGAFGEPETSALLRELSRALHARLRADLAFQLTDYSLGYPWLLKRLCAHVIRQRDRGTKQADLAIRMLNVGELFEEDTADLTGAEKSALYALARRAPVSVAEFAADHPVEVLQSLIHRRLVIPIGDKLDVYWDIFKDYLNTRAVPAQESYVLRYSAGGVLAAYRKLRAGSSEVSFAEGAHTAGHSEKSFYNVLRELKQLGLVEVSEGHIRVVRYDAEGRDEETPLRAHLAERLRHNRAASAVLTHLRSQSTATLDDVAGLLEEAHPYVRADRPTWLSYAKTLVGWMDRVDLAVLRGQTVIAYDPAAGVRQERALLSEKAEAEYLPEVQAERVEELVVALVGAVRDRETRVRVPFGPDRLRKALYAARALGFLIETAHAIRPLPPAEAFADDHGGRPALFLERAMTLRTFREFRAMLEAGEFRGKTNEELGRALARRLDVRWQPAFATVAGKVLVNWLKYTGLLPSVRRRPERESRDQPPLWTNAELGQPQGDRT